MNRWEEYIQWTKDNPKLVSDKVKKAISRFEKMVKTSKKKTSLYYFDEEQPNTIIEFAETYLKIIKDDEIKNIKVYPWQAFILASIYGFKYKSDNTRVVKTAIISTAKKNGKSTFESIPILYELFGRKGAQIYLAALNKQQTMNVFEPVALMIDQSTELKEYLEISKKMKTVLKADSYSFINTLTKGAETKQGIKPTLAIIDEYYLYRNDDLTNILKYGFRSVTNPLLIIISTNGKDKNTPFYQEYERCSKILDGIIEDDSTFAIFYEYDLTDKWDDKGKLIKSNPMLGETLSYEKDFKSDLEEARNKPFKQSDFKQFTCNLWTDTTSENWIPDDKFKVCMKDLPSEEYLKTLPSVLSFDLSKVNDFTVLTQYFKDKEVYYGRHWFYIPESEIEKKEDENINIKYWIEEGLITPTPGQSVDYEFMSNKILELVNNTNVLAVTYDRYQSKFVMSYLSSVTTVDFDQSLKSFSQPTKNWEKYIYDKKIVDNNPIMRWMVSCATIKPDANNNYKPMKPDSIKSTKRIDAVITSIMALDVLNSMIDTVGSKADYSYDDIMKLLK